MTKQEVYGAVQAQMDDFTAPFLDRIMAALPMAVAKFIEEYQWEFLSKYVTTTASLDATLNKYVIGAPTDDDLFKPVHIWTDKNDDVEWIPQSEWAKRQASVGSGTDIVAYTMIGSQMVLDRTAGADTIYMIYTRDATDITFEDVPGQYHAAIVAELCEWLTPMILKDGQGNELANPAYRESELRTIHAIERAVGLEMSSKGRHVKPPINKQMELRGRYR